MQFHELRLLEPIVRAVVAEGYEIPTPIQAKAIPIILQGRDVLGSAQTGTGKTGAFAMPILHRLAQGQRPHQPKPRDPRTSDRRGRGRRPRASQHLRPGMPRALVLSPTRELATQIHESFRTYGGNLKLRHTAVFGGVPQYGQVRSMQHGVDVVVATPGRLLDLMNQGHIDVRAIEVLVLDEADHMLDMGFIHDIRRIIQQLPKKRQTLLFSATMPSEIRSLANAILTEPEFVEVDRVSSPVEAIEQSVYLVPRNHKPILLERLIRRERMSRTLVFTRTKHGADKLVKKLLQTGLTAAAIHGNKTQNARTRALESFKSGAMPVLVATDIAARGIDVANISHVVNYDIPIVAETYVHRIGRTARAGAGGVALSFCDHDERKALQAVERLLKKQLFVESCDQDLCNPSQRDEHASKGKARNKRDRSNDEGGRNAGRGGRVDRNRSRGKASSFKSAHGSRGGGSTSEGKTESSQQGNGRRPRSGKAAGATGTATQSRRPRREEAVDQDRSNGGRSGRTTTRQPNTRNGKPTSKRWAKKNTARGSTATIARKSTQKRRRAG